MDANQYGIHQGTFRDSAVYICTEADEGVLEHLWKKQLLPFCDIVTKSSIL